MNLTDFDFDLPSDLIAQRPLEQRDGSRLFVVPAGTSAFSHRQFSDLPELLGPDDLLVLNDTRVFPARLHGRKESGGKVEVLLLEPVPAEASDPEGTAWRCLLNASRKPRPGAALRFDGGVQAEVVAREEMEWVLRFRVSSGDLAEALKRAGSVPLPPYIHRDEGEASGADVERYQTVFAREEGAVAAPTAGLHFTEALLDQLNAIGVRTTYLTLHVGPGTFLPVREERVEDHAMHAERFSLPQAAADAIQATRDRGGRVIAVGTTATRTLEHQAIDGGRVQAGRGATRLFIYPGYRFQVVDALITNFHLPQSTLLMLVSAFAGCERILQAYREAVERGYRFYSYGDAMLLTR